MKLRRFLIFSIPLLLICITAGLCFGSAPLSLPQLLEAFSPRGDTGPGIILWQLRLPRVAAGLLAGVGLSLSGVLLQTVTANPLAGPNIIGVNSGAGLAVIGLLTVAPTTVWLLPVGAFLGAFGAALLILLAADRLGGSRTGIVLIGIAITTILNSVISFLSLLDEGVLAQYNHFTVGSLKGVRLEELAVPAVIIFLSLGLAMVLGRKLGILCLGDAAASALGIRVKGLRLLALGCAAASAAAVVSFAGLLGFVGLMVPHIARGLVGQQPRRQLPAAVITGALLVTAADLLGRTLFAPSELPVGILLSVIGGPYFLYLLIRRKRHAGAI